MRARQYLSREVKVIKLKKCKVPKVPRIFTVVQYQSRKFTITEMAISTPTYYTLKYLGDITHVTVLRCTNYIQVVYFFWWFRTILST